MLIDKFSGRCRVKCTGKVLRKPFFMFCHDKKKYLHQTEQHCEENTTSSNIKENFPKWRVFSAIFDINLTNQKLMQVELKSLNSLENTHLLKNGKQKP